MANNKNNRSVLLPNAIGDWTKYRPSFSQEKKARSPIKGKVRLSEKELGLACQGYIKTVESLISVLKENLESPSDLNSITVEQMNYSDILKEADFPLAQFRLFEEGAISGYLCVSLDLCSCLINRALGTSALAQQDPKMLTKIEESILESCLEDASISALPNYSLTLADSSSLSFDQPFGENGPFAFICAKIDFADIKNGKILIAVPSSLVRQQLEKGTSAFSPRALARLSDRIKDGIHSDIKALLGSTFISAKDLYGLEEGDVILLDSNINNLVPVRVNDCLKLFGQPGIKNDKIGIRIFSHGTRRQERFVEPLPAVEEEPAEDIPSYEDMPAEPQDIPMEGQMANF
jgi:flagellar motor switch protein FliM